MIPILYEKDEVLFASNGLGRLRDTISAVVTEERNGVYELSIEYPVTGLHYEDIQCGRIIAVEHDDSNDIQPFDIVSYSRPINGIVTFHCQHISYRQSKMTASGTNINSLANAFTLLKSASPSNPFIYQTDKNSTGFMASADGIPRSVRSILGGVEGSILDAYGGEYEWDKFIVKLWSARGTARDLTIRYGVNLTDYQEDTDYSETYTAVIPYWTGDDGAGGTTVVKGNMVNSGAVSYDGRTSCIPLDLTDKFENKPTAAQLQTMAASLLATDQPYLPSQTIKVDFIRLQDTPEYAQYASLMECKLCDTIRVEFPRYSMSGRFKIVKTVYDVLQERFTSMELGTLSTTLSEALGISSGDSSGKEYATPLVFTRVNNSYVNATDFARIKGNKIGSVGVINFNLLMSATLASGGSFLKIGTVSPAPAQEVLNAIPSQGNNSTLIVQITTGGDINIINQSGTATGTTFFRASIPVWFG